LLFRFDGARRLTIAHRHIPPSPFTPTVLTTAIFFVTYPQPFTIKTKPAVMRQFLMLAFVCVVFTACDKIKPIEGGGDGMGSDTLHYAFKAQYTSDFEIGNPKYAKIVLDVAKAYQQNDLATMRDAFADTVMADFADGSSFRGPKDSLIKAVTDARSGFDSVKTVYGMWVSLQPRGRDEAWVATWCRETDILKDGTRQTMFLDENWQFNKDGKISYMMQNARKPHPVNAAK
jgi:hypothetical protein